MFFPVGGGQSGKYDVWNGNGNGKSDKIGQGEGGGKKPQEIFVVFICTRPLTISDFSISILWKPAPEV